MNLKTEITKIHYNPKAKGVLVSVLEGLSFFYGLGSGFKNWLYDKKILRPKRVNAYVISVGNMTTGGVGKTPVVLELAKYFASKGEKTAVISRGYGGKLSNSRVNVMLQVLHGEIPEGDGVIVTTQEAGQFSTIGATAE